MTEHQQPKPALDLDASAVEVERRGRFQYAVILRVPNGFDMSMERPCWFRWSALRLARKVRDRELRRRQPASPVIASFPIDMESR